MGAGWDLRTLVQFVLRRDEVAFGHFGPLGCDFSEVHVREARNSIWAARGGPDLAGVQWK